MDFQSPSVTQVADFLMHLFQDRKLHPSTIDGYRTAIADMVGNDRWHISKNENLTHLLDSFHQDKPKGRRGVPSWNLSLVHQLTKAPFEPMRKASRKHLTFKSLSWLWVLVRGVVRSMPGCIEIFDIRRTGPKCLYTCHPVSCLRINWLKSAHRLLLRWLFQPWLRHLTN